MNKFTPGPWYIDKTTVYALNPQNFNRFCAQVQGAHTPIAELEATARLIAAAPDLLGALEELSAAYSDALRDEFNITECPLIDKARAAIARAKGESN